VLVDGNDINPLAAKCFENRLELGFKHDKIADDERVLRCTSECCPRVNAHRISDGAPARHFCLVPDRNLVHAILRVALLGKNLAASEAGKKRRTAQRLTVPNITSQGKD